MLAEFRVRLANWLLRGIAMKTKVGALSDSYPVTLIGVARFKAIWLETDQIVEIPVEELLPEDRW